MKKILLLITALALTIGATAQEKSFTYGFKAGVNLAQISSGSIDYGSGYKLDRDATDMLAGFFLSAHANYSFSKFFGAQAELSFSMQGGKYSNDITFGGVPIGKVIETTHLNYINVPVLFEVKPITNLSIFVGPQIGFNIYKSRTIEGLANGEDFVEKVNTVDFAAVVGAQYAIMGKYLISARYNFGFTPVFNQDNVSDMASRVLQIGIGYQF